MTYTEAVAYLESLGRFGMRFGLSRMEYLTAWLGHPEHRYAVLHVLGTNGKGSTAAMLAGVLRTAGYRVGLYTSPHLHEYTERIRVNGRPVAKQRFADAIRLVQRAARAAAQAGLEHPTAFEVLTAAAYQLLADEGVEVLVQEAGLGGRLDATACVPTPMVTVFTRIALDHVERLGPTAVAIAREKAAAVKGGIVVLAPQEPAVAAVVEEMALARGAAVVLVGREAVAEGVRCGPDGCRFTYRGTRWTVPDLHVPLPGYHQVENATAAAAALEAAARSGLRLGPLHLREGLAQTQWPGRLEVVRRRPWVVLDGAHNPNGAEALRRSLALFPHRRYLLVAGVLADKDAAGILGALAAGAHRVVLTRPEGPRAADPVTLADLLPPDTPRTVEPDPVRAVTEALRDAGEEDLICVAGSLFLVGPIRRYFTGETAPLPG